MNVKLIAEEIIANPANWQRIKTENLLEWKAICELLVHRFRVGGYSDELLIDVCKNTTLYYVQEILSNRSDLIKKIDKKELLVMLDGTSDRWLESKDIRYIVGAVYENLDTLEKLKSPWYLIGKAFEYKTSDDSKYQQLLSITEACLRNTKQDSNDGYRNWLEILIGFLPEGPIFDAVVERDKGERLTKYVKKLDAAQFKKLGDYILQKSSGIDRAYLALSIHCHGIYLKHALMALSRLKTKKYGQEYAINVPLTNKNFEELNSQDRLMLCARIFTSSPVFKNVIFDKKFNFDTIPAMLLSSVVSGKLSKQAMEQIVRHVDRFKTKTKEGNSYLVQLTNLIMTENRNDFYMDSSRTSMLVNSLKHLILKLQKNKRYEWIISELFEFLYAALSKYSKIDIALWNEERCKALLEELKKVG